MARRRLIIAGAAALLLLSAAGWLVLAGQKPYILFLARNRYNAAKNNGSDLSKGPCLGKISDDWVLDIAHLPREAVDDDPANQCGLYLNGTVRHFVEMTPKGEVITVR